MCQRPRRLVGRLRSVCLPMADRTLRALIVDDEAPARALLNVMSSENDVHVIGEAETGETAVDLCQNLRSDLVLLDIGMPGIGGMEAARRIAALPAPPAIVFTTAFEGFALAAFDTGAVDYLLKPIEDRRFATMLERVRAVIDGRSSLDDHIWLPIGAGLKRISVEAIDVVSADRDYVQIEVEGRAHILRATMVEMAKKLDRKSFLRVHRSTIVRRDLITGLRHEGSGVWSILVADDRPIRIGRSYLENTREALRA